MNSKIVMSAVIDFVITFGTALIALLSVEGVTVVTDVPQAALVSAFIGGVLAAAKGYKTYLSEAPL